MILLFVLRGSPGWGRVHAGEVVLLVGLVWVVALQAQRAVLLCLEQVLLPVLGELVSFPQREVASVLY